MTIFKSTRLMGLILLGLLVHFSGCGPKKVPQQVSTEPLPEFQVIEHTLLPGETLEIIADNYYGDPAQVANIARDNGISDPSKVAEGSVLALRFEDSQWEEARQRAAAMVPYNRGVDLLGQERLAEAGRQFQLALNTAPGLVGAQYNLALVNLRRGMTDAALDLLVDLTDKRPENTDFLFARGNALFQVARFDEAAQQFQRVLNIDPEHLRAAFSLGRSLQEGETPGQAVAAWERYLTLDSSSSWAEAARRNLRKLSHGGS